jgi:hypothetical protein
VGVALFQFCIGFKVILSLTLQTRNALRIHIYPISL